MFGDSKHVRAKLPAYLTGALSYEERREVDAHLADCARCRKWMTDLRAKQARIKREALKRAVAEPLPNLFLARLGRQSKMTPSHPRPRVVAAGLGLVLAAVVLIFLKRDLTSWRRISAKASAPAARAVTVLPPAAPSSAMLPALGGAPAPRGGTVASAKVSPPAGSARPPTPVVAPEKVVKEEPPPALAAVAPPAKAPRSALVAAREPNHQQWKGTYCLVKDYREVVVRDGQAWHALWQEMGQYGDAPKINFDTSMVVGVLGGEKPSAGYGVTITTATERAEDVLVQYETTEPPPGSINPQMVTHPFALSVVARSDKPVRFSKRNS